MAIASTQSSSSSCIINNHHYALDAAKLVDKCRIALRSILRHIDERSESAKDTATATSATASTTTPRRHRRVARELLALDDALNCADRLVHAHLLDLLDREMEYLSSVPRRNGGGGASNNAARYCTTSSANTYDIRRYTIPLARSPTPNERRANVDCESPPRPPRRRRRRRRRRAA